MKKFLPTSKGFTLIELLVVIVIMAILATIGTVIFLGVQKNARDGKRVAEIDAIAKSLESAKDMSPIATGGAAVYVNSLGTTADFPRGVPADPVGSADSNNRYNYCISTNSSAGQYAADPTTWPLNSDCPTGSPTYVIFNSAWVTAYVPPYNVKSWQICARKENGNAVYCRRSLQ